MSDLRQLPSIDKLIQEEALKGFSERIRTAAARAAVDQGRTLLRAGTKVDVLQAAVVLATAMSGQSVAPAINMSGVVLHTGLGRARLAPDALAAVASSAQGHATVEFDRESGKRGNRQDHVRWMLKELTGAEDALVVNNCAAAVFLALQATALGREVILSRGQMVEIGGSFRMPDIVAQSGCSLVEVGCTNKTRVQDYERALTHSTAAVLRCHPSNFQITGFHEEPSAQDLAEFAHKHGLAMIDDVGSGCLIDTERFGLPHERTLREALKDGADIVTASGDKLLGGPQAGIVLGKQEHVQRLAKSPLARAVRVGKLTLAALEATLKMYVEDRAQEIPVWKYVARPAKEVEKDAKKIAAAAKGAKVEKAMTEIGGGSLPGTTVETYRVGLPGDAEENAAYLRSRQTPVVGYIADGVFWLDPRTSESDEVAAVVLSLQER